MAKMNYVLKFLKNRRAQSKILPIALIVLCIYNTLENDSLSADRQLRSEPEKYGPGKYNGRYKYCRTPYVLIDNVMATMPEIAAPEERIDPPSHVQLCQAYLDRSELDSDEIQGLPEIKVVEDPAICLDWSAPHFSIMTIFASSLVASKGLDLGLRYNHNCHNYMLMSRDDHNTKYDYTTAQQVLTENLISSHDANQVKPNLVKSLCHGCISHHQQAQPTPLGGITHHCFLFPGGQSARSLKENRQELPLTSVLSSFVDRMRHLTEDWIDSTDPLDFEDESGVIIALDDKSSFMELGFYERILKSNPTSIQIFASVSCAVASVQGTSDCIEHGRSLKAYFKRLFPETTYVRYDVVASTATMFARMMSSSILICPPGTVSCLLPALGKLASKKAYVAEDGSKPATYHWFEDIIEKRKGLGLQRPGYDAVPDEDFLIISEEISQELPKDLPKEDLDHEVHHSTPIIDANADEIEGSGRSVEPLEIIDEKEQGTNEETTIEEIYEEVTPIDEETTVEEVINEEVQVDPTIEETIVEENTIEESDPTVEENTTEEIILTEPVETSNQDSVNDQATEVEEHNEISIPPLETTDMSVVETDVPSPEQVELVPIYDFWHNSNKDHTFHSGDPREGEMKGNVQFYAYPVEVVGAQPVYSFFAEEVMDFTLHFGDPWPGENQINLEFYAFPGPVDGLDLQPIYTYWHDADHSHTFHFGEPWDGEVREDRIVFYATPPM